MDKENRAQRKLFEFLQKEIRQLQKQILDLTEVSVNPNNWKVMRSKILGITNDLKRSLEQELSLNYSIKFDPSIICEDVIEVKGSLNQSLTGKERQEYGTGKKEI